VEKALTDAAPQVRIVTAHLANAFGNQRPLALLRQEEMDKQRQQQVDMQNELAKRSMALNEERSAREALAFETPDERENRAIGLKRKELELQQEFAPPKIMAGTTDPATGRQILQVNRQGAATPVTTTIPRPELGPKPVMGPLVKPPTMVKAPLYEPSPLPKQDMSLSEAELADRAARGDKIAEDALKRLAEQKKAGRTPPQGIPGSGESIYDKDTGNFLGKWFAEGGPQGTFVPAPPNLGGKPLTADERNKAAARARIEPAINEVEAIGKRVITAKAGIAQSAIAAGRSVESVLGSDPDWKTYQAARKALAINLAVASQGSRPSDVDMKAWLELVPDAFVDTAESAEAKWKLIRVQSRIGQSSELNQGNNAPPHPAPAGQKWQQNTRTKEWRLVPIQ